MYTRRLVETRIRAYDEGTDLRQADELEKMCEAGPSGKVSLFTDLLGDPLCRVRHYPAYAMLVAETQPDKKIVGLIRAGVKEVACGLSQLSECKSGQNNSAAEQSQLSECKSGQNDSAAEPPNMFVLTAYILGLRVAPRCRRLGIGGELVKKMEEWCKERGAEYVYIATEKDNEASVGLFTRKLGYVKFRNPAILVQPVYVSSKRLSRKVQVVELSREEACKLYNTPSLFSASEFFPKDIDAVVKSTLHRGTWLAFFKNNKGGSTRNAAHAGAPSHHHHPPSWAVLSLWKCNEIYQLEMKGAPLRLRLLAAASRAVGKLLAWLTALPTMPDVFKPFGLQLIYGIHAEGPDGLDLARNLCWHAHNLAKDDGCAVVAAEVAGCDPLRRCIPHWTNDEDLWCIKRLASAGARAEAEAPSCDWSKVPPPSSLFLDPRDF